MDFTKLEVIRQEVIPLLRAAGLNDPSEIVPDKIVVTSNGINITSHGVNKTGFHKKSRCIDRSSERGGQFCLRFVK